MARKNKEPVVFTYERNHRAEQQGIWFPYTGFRYKDMYDIELHDGTILTHMRPNSYSWYQMDMSENAKAKSVEVKVNDPAVKSVRLKPDSELNEKFYEMGQERIDYQNELFD